MSFVTIPDFPLYSVNEDGVVLGQNGTALKTRSVRGDYVQVVLYRDKKRHQVYVHHLVLSAFVGPRPDGMEACHGDGDQTNNRLTNLRWDTHEANVADRVNARTHCKNGHDLEQHGKWYTNGPGKRARICNKCRREAYHERKCS